MARTALLYTTNKEPWLFDTDKDIQDINPDDFARKLYDRDNLISSGVPSLFSHPFVFSKKLEAEDAGALQQFSRIIKGIFLGIICPETIGMDALGSLGRIARAFEKEMDNFVILQWDGKVIGGVYPECLVFPAPDGRVSMNDLMRLDTEIGTKIGEFGDNNVLGCFSNWVNQIIKPWERENNATTPIWVRAISRVRKEWVSQSGAILNPMPDGESYLELENALVSCRKNPTFKITDDVLNDLATKNVAQATIGQLRPLKDQPRMIRKDFVNSLDKIIGTNNSDKDLIIKSAREDYIDIKLVRYMKEIVKCEGYGTQPCYLSHNDTTVAMGKDRHILCKRLDANSFVCGDACQAGTGGKGPQIEESGFFENPPSSGKYIIWKGFDNANIPKGCTGVEYREKCAIFTFGRLNVRVTGTIVTKDEIFCSRVVKFSHNNESRVPDIPIKSEYFYCIADLARCKKPDDKNNAYTVSLKGLGDMQHTPAVEDKGAASILLWPLWSSLAAPGWEINYAFFYPSDSAVGDISVKLLDKEGKEIGCVSGRSGIKTPRYVDYVEILLRDKSPVGIFKDTRSSNTLVNVAGNVDMALDFGTSNSIVVVKEIKGGGTVNYSKIDLKNHTVDILGYYFRSEVIFKNVYWLPSYGNPDKVFISSIPSELFFVNKEDPDHLGVPGDQNNKPANPIKEYSIPNPGYERADAGGSVVYDFKWVPRPPFAEHAEPLKREYLSMFMHMVLGVVRENGNTTINLYATYPLAFGDAKREDYATLLRQLCTQLKQDTGMQIILHDLLIHESYAANARCTDTGYHLVVDVGGGTTDIALSEGTEMLAWDSIRYAGGHFVRSLARCLPARVFGGDGKNISDKKGLTDGEKEKEKEIFLNREIRLGRFKDLITSLNDKEKPIVLRKLMVFYEWLFNYLDLMVRKYASDVNKAVTLHTIGSGWQFMDAIEPPPGAPYQRGDIKGYIENTYYKDRQGLSVKVNIAELGNKEAIARGALMGAQLYRPPTDPNKPIKSVVGCDIIVSFRNMGARNTINIKNDDEVSIELKGIPQQATIDSLDVAGFPSLQAATDCHNILPTFNSCILRSNAIFCHTTDKKWYLTKSPFAIFLEEIVTNKLL